MIPGIVASSRRMQGVALPQEEYFFSNVLALINGTNGTISEAKGRTITVGSGVTAVAATPDFQHGSMLFDGSENAKITYNSPSDWFWARGDFSVEFKYQPISKTSNPVIFSTCNVFSNNVGFAVYDRSTNNKLVATYNGTTILTSATDIVDGAVYEVVIVRFDVGFSSSTWLMYINGQLEDSRIGLLNNGDVLPVGGTFLLGCGELGNETPIHGRLSNFRVRTGPVTNPYTLDASHFALPFPESNTFELSEDDAARSGLIVISACNRYPVGGDTWRNREAFNPETTANPININMRVGGVRLTNDFNFQDSNNSIGIDYHNSNTLRPYVESGLHDFHIGNLYGVLAQAGSRSADDARLEIIFYDEFETELIKISTVSASDTFGRTTTITFDQGAPEVISSPSSTTASELMGLLYFTENQIGFIQTEPWKRMQNTPDWVRSYDMTGVKYIRGRATAFNTQSEEAFAMLFVIPNDQRLLIAQPPGATP